MAEVSAEAAVKVAKKNITNNTETTIQVSWSGGGFIKPSKLSRPIPKRKDYGYTSAETHHSG